MERGYGSLYKVGPAANDGHERCAGITDMQPETRRLTDQEINTLLHDYRTTGNAETRDRIVVQFGNLVESVARRFGGAEPVEDLVQEGYIGLITAVDGYDASKGVKFSTYATHFVIGQIKHFLRDRGKIIKEPAWLQELNQKITRVIEVLSQELGRMPTPSEIGKLVDMTEEAVADLMTTREVFKVASLDGGGEAETDQPSTYDMDRVVADRQVEIEVPVEDKVVLETALNKLKDLEQKVVYEFYYRGQNQTEIARAMGISCNYVSHILRNSTRKLKKILVSDELKEAQTELALTRKRLEEQSTFIEEHAIVDPMTQLYNRRYFEQRLDEEICRASRHQYPVAVLMISLDGSDGLSRAYGTLRAEDTIRHASTLMRKTVRRSDIITRYDTGKFALILPYTAHQVSIVADRLLFAITEWLHDEKLDTGKAPITLSWGAACYPDEASTATDLTACADAALHPAADGNAAVAA